MATHAYVSVPLSAPQYFSPRPCVGEESVDRIDTEGDHDGSPLSSASSSPTAYSPSFMIPMSDAPPPPPQAAVRLLPRTRLSFAGSAVSLVLPFSLSPTTLLIVLYFTLNLTLTFYNKSLLNNFPFPYFITSLHAASGVIGCACLRLAGVPFTSAAAIPTASPTHKRSSSSQQPAEEKGASSAQEPLLSSSPSSLSVLSTSSQGEASGSTERSSGGRTVAVLLYSALYAANIAMSNASLSLVSVPFHQIVRSTCPLFTLTLSYVLLSKSSFSQRSTVALLPIVWGAAMSCVGGTIRYTRWGVILTVFGTFLAALKTVTTNLLQGGNKANASTANASSSTRKEDDPHQKQALASQTQNLSQYSFHYSALELLEVMSPLACIQCLAASFFSGELQLALQHLYVVDEGVLDKAKIASLLGNGAIAFLLNVVSFKTNRAAGPLTMTVVGNVKQVVTILLALYLYRMPLAPINAFGIFIALIGTVWYGAEEVRAKRLRSAVNSG